MNFQNSLVPFVLLLFVLFLIILPCNSASSGSRRKKCGGRAIDKQKEGSERKVDNRNRISRQESGHREKSDRKKKNERGNEEEDVQKDEGNKYKYNRNQDEGSSRRDYGTHPYRRSRSWPVSATEVRRKSYGKAAQQRECRRISDGSQSADVYEYGQNRSRTGRRRISNSVGREGRRSESWEDDGQKSGENGGERRRHSNDDRRRGSSQSDQSHSRKHKSILTSAAGSGNSKSDAHKSEVKGQDDEQKEAGEKVASSSSSNATTTLNDDDIKELYSVKDGNYVWRVKDYYGKNRVLTNDTTGDDIYHSIVEISKKGVNKKMLKMEYEISIAIQLLANMNKTTKRKILNIGLGGGEMANFLGELDPTMEITSVEISNSVIEIARKYFGFMKGQSNQSVLNEDGIEYIKRVAQQESNIFGAILVDACNATSESILTCPVNGFITEEMAQKIQALLMDGGVLVMNIYADKSVKPDAVKQELLKLQAIFSANFARCYFVKIENNENMTFTCVKSSQQTKSKIGVMKSQREFEKMVAGIKIPAARWAKTILNQIKTQLMLIE